ncbi:MAG: hypothetical protein E5V24_14220, partial [Mesorhizobium sp.]
FPDGVERQSWPDISYFRVRPLWARFSDFRASQRALWSSRATSFGDGQAAERSMTRRSRRPRQNEPERPLLAAIMSFREARHTAIFHPSQSFDAYFGGSAAQVFEPTGRASFRSSVRA